MSFRVRLHVHAPGDHSLGPGKIALLEAVDAEGSISAASRALGMAYRHAWMLIDDMNRCFRAGVVATGAGGAGGGGAVLTPFGRQLVRRFRAMEQAANEAIEGDLAALAAELAASPVRKRARAQRAKR